MVISTHLGYLGSHIHAGSYFLKKKNMMAKSIYFQNISLFLGSF